MKFDVFGRKLEVIRENGQWIVFALGEGKKRKTDIAIPDEIQRTDLAKYLTDLFHEMSTPEKPEVVPLD